MIVLDLRKKPEGLDQQRIQAALDEVREQPGSTVIIPPGIYTLTSPRARRPCRKPSMENTGKIQRSKCFDRIIPLQLA